MSDSPVPDRRHRRRLIVTLTISGLVVLGLSGVRIYGLVTGPATPPSHAEALNTPTPTPGETEEHPAATSMLPYTTDPETYARAVAQALFDWDTFTLLTPADYRAVLIEDADPTGTETPGLITDLDNYLPSAATWRELAQYRTSQHLTIDRIYIPQQWYDAVAAARGQIVDGTIAYTIEGTRHRAGVWYDDPVDSAHPVAFTVFVSCEPVFDRCHLLRLSELDRPLQ